MPRRNKFNAQRPEEALHRQVADFLRLALGPGVVWFHIPNGGARSKAEAGILKALGTRAGMPDLGFVFNGRADFIELKPERRYLSSVQKNCHVELEQAGARVVVCRSVGAVEATLRVWGYHLKASVLTREVA